MCENPFWKCKKKYYDVEVYILYKGRQLAVCEKCWNKIAESDIQWSS